MLFGDMPLVDTTSKSLPEAIETLINTMSQQGCFSPDGTVSKVDKCEQLIRKTLTDATAQLRKLPVSLSCCNFSNKDLERRDTLLETIRLSNSLLYLFLNQPCDINIRYLLTLHKIALFRQQYPGM